MLGNAYAIKRPARRIVGTRCRTRSVIVVVGHLEYEVEADPVSAFELAARAYVHVARLIGCLSRGRLRLIAA